MDLRELRGLMEAYQQVNAPHQLDEISQKTATSAYAASKTGEFEGADSDRDIKRSDNLRRHIKRKFGAGAAKHADRAADSMTFGRKDASGKSKGLPKSRIEKSDYRTTQDGKMHKQDQKELKTNLRIKRDKRLRAARGEDTNEQFDIFDVVLEFLQAEGYAETLEEAEWMMANVIDEEAIGIILGEEQLNELSNRTVSNALNARIAATGAASDRAYKHRNPEAMRAAEDAADKEASMRSAVAKRRKRMNKEEYMDEAQEARNNPEKYEAGEKKKYAPVRGERTPMPPRGDKRREDFEKWYATNVR